MNDKTPNSEPGGRRAYTTPSLVDYGAVAKLTQGSANVGADAGVGMMNAGCL